MKSANTSFSKKSKKITHSFSRAPSHKGIIYVFLLKNLKIKIFNKILIKAPCSDDSPPIFNGFECKICGFQNTSKFHFNSHMNTHM